MVVTYRSLRPEDDHERATHSAIARTIAGLKGVAFGGEYDPSARYGHRLYFVPSDTLTAESAAALGIRTQEDLFGGVVPFAFIGTKAIVHPLIERTALAPAGWSAAFPQRVRGVVLPGFTAFSVDDAHRAAKQLLAQGAVRLKPGHAVGGHDQLVVSALSELEGALARLDPIQLERSGLAIELDLEDVTTYSVGQVSVAGILATYVGTQRTTRDNRGQTVFGGSDLVVVRGGFEALDALPWLPATRLAIDQARTFDAATEELTPMFASRRNYDAVRGRDAAGRWRCGVLEQSWRIGGASGAELAALAAFHADRDLRVVHARCTEAYGEALAPQGAIVQFSGTDSRIGPLAKYTLVEAYEPA
jgi:hypothetical protein